MQSWGRGVGGGSSEEWERELRPRSCWWLAGGGVRTAAERRGAPSSLSHRWCCSHAPHLGSWGSWRTQSRELDHQVEDRGGPSSSRFEVLLQMLNPGNCWGSGRNYFGPSGRISTWTCLLPKGAGEGLWPLGAGWSRAELAVWPHRTYRWPHLALASFVTSHLSSSLDSFLPI